MSMKYDYQKFKRVVYTPQYTIDDTLKIVRAWFKYSGETECMFNGKLYKLIDNMIVF